MGDHISDLLGTQGQPEIDEENIGVDGGLDGGQLDDGGSEPPAAASEPPASGEPPEPKPNRRGNVPLAALQEERARRQELQDQYNSERERNDRAEQRLQQMMQLFQQQQPQQPPPKEEGIQIPNFVDDPEGHVNALRAQFERELAKLQETSYQQQQASQANQQIQQLAAAASRAEEEFKAVTPDYLQAADFFLKRKQAEYTAFGLDPVTLNAQVQRDYQGLVVASMQMGKNPAQVLYNMAKAMGYTTTTPAKPAAGQRQAPAGRPVPPTSLSDLGGSPRGAPDEEGDLTAEKLADMSDTEFDKFWNKMARQNRVSPRF